jgi:hypothetical protein
MLYLSVPFFLILLNTEGHFPRVQFPNLGLVICAGIFLMAAQITVAAVSGCYGCCKSRAISSGTKQIVGIVCAIFSSFVSS